MKRALLFVSNLFPDAANPVRGLDNATLLHELAGRFEVRVLALRPTLGPAAWGGGGDWTPRPIDAPFHPEYLGVPYIPKFGSLWNHRLAALRLRPRVARWRVANPHGAVLGAWLFPDGAALGSLAAGLGFRPVLVAQGSDVHQYLAVPARRRAILDAVAASGAVVTRSRDLRDKLIAAGAPPERVVCIYNGVNTEAFRPCERAPLRAALGLAENEPVVLCVGNLLPVKNPELLVRALATLPMPRPRLVFAGTGPLEGRLKELTGTIGVEARFVGRLDPVEIAKWMSAVDLLCIPSLNEGVPNVLLEAQAAGLPVIATAVGGIPEIVIPGVTGLLVPSGNPALLGQAIGLGLRQAWEPNRIREIGGRFSWKATSDQYTRLLDAASKPD